MTSSDTPGSGSNTQGPQKAQQIDAAGPTNAILDETEGGSGRKIPEASEAATSADEDAEAATSADEDAETATSADEDSDPQNQRDQQGGGVEQAPPAQAIPAPPQQQGYQQQAPGAGPQPGGQAEPQQAAGPPTATATRQRRSSRVRKARLRLVRVDPWSVMKTAFLLSIAFGIMLVVAVTVLWSILDASGVFDSVGGLLTDITATDASPGLAINEYVQLPRVLGVTLLVSVVDVVLLTALATLGAFLYNLAASLLGGLELTLAEDE